jgi:hypothetical protein
VSVLALALLVRSPFACDCVTLFRELPSHGEGIELILDKGLVRVKADKFPPLPGAKQWTFERETGGDPFDGADLEARVFFLDLGFSCSFERTAPGLSWSCSSPLWFLVVAFGAWPAWAWHAGWRKT